MSSASATAMVAPRTWGGTDATARASHEASIGWPATAGTSRPAPAPATRQYVAIADANSIACHGQSREPVNPPTTKYTAPAAPIAAIGMAAPLTVSARQSFPGRDA